MKSSSFRAALSAAIFPLLAIFLFAAFPGAASAQNAARQILQLTLSPSNGVIDLADEVTQSDCVGRAAASAPLDCPVVRVTPRFSRTSDRPSVPTIVKILPITPIITTTGVIARGETTFTLNQAAKDRTAETKKALDAAWAALSAARTAIKDANSVGRGATPAEIRARRDTWRAYLRAEKAHHAALTAAALGVTRHAKNVQVYKSDGTIRQQVKPDAPKFRPDGYVPVSGDQYAVYGDDYFLTDGQFVANPDGTFDPPYFEVRALKKDAPRDLTAMFGLYVSTGDKKYNRPAAQGGSAAEFAVKLKAPDKTLPNVEVALVHAENTQYDEQGNLQITKKKPATTLARTMGETQGTFHDTVEGGLIQPARLLARLVTPAGGVPIAAESAIHLKLPRLPLGLVRGLRASAPSTLTLSPGRALVYQPLQDTLTIPAGKSAALTDLFIIYPSTYAGEYKLAAPVIVDAAGNPLKNTGMTTSGRVVTVEKAADTGFTSLALPSAAERLRAEEPLADRYYHGALAPAALTATLDGITGPVHINTHHVEVRVSADDTTGANSADFTDFMKRNPDGSFSPLTAAQFPDTYIPPVQLARYDRYFRVPIFPRDDRLVEGEETFKVRLNENDSGEKVATIPANGAVTLNAGYISSDGQRVSAELNLSGDNFGIVVGSGGSVVFENDNSSLQLEFTDTTGRDGSGGADGILSGAELSTTANWSYNASRLRLAIDSAALPAGLQGGQFTGMTLPAAPTAPVVVDIISNTGLTLTEGGSTSDPTVAIRIRPPLQQAATLQILTVGKADGNSFTADASGEFADIRAVQEVRLPIGRGFESADERVIEVALSHIIDDLRVEPDETFQIKLHARPNDPFVVGATIRTITIKDDDTATFTVEQDPPGQLRRGGTVTLTGRLSAPVQVNAGDTITFEEDGLSTNGHQDIVFTDNNPNDGYIRGAEMTSDVSIDVDTLLGAAAYRHFYSDLTIGSTTLRKAAFLLPYADHPDRAQLPWHADVHYELPKIAPRHAPGSASFSGVIRVSESDLSATVPVSLNFDFIRDHTFGEARVVVTAYYDPDGDGPLPARSVSKTDVTYDDSEDSTTAQNQEFTTADFNALGIRDDEVINQTRTVTTTIALNDSTRRIVNHGITVFSGKTIRGPDITIEDDDASPAGGKQVSVHLSLADANGRPITRLQAGKRTDAFLLAEIREDGARDDARKVAVDKALSVAIGLSTAGNALSWTDLGRPDIPRAVLIRPGESSGLSARALRITPGKQGSFGFVSTSITPQNFGAFSAASAVSVAHSVIAPGGKNWLATLDNTEVTVNEGNTGLTAAVTLVDAETGLASAFSRNGSGEALTLHYAIGLLPGGAVAADLTAAAASGSASSNVPCARCSEVFGTPFSTGTVTIASGATTARIPLPGIVNDATPEDAEKFTLALTALLDSNGLPPFANGAQVARVGLAEAAADYIIAASDGGAPTTASAPQLFATPLVVLQEALDADATPAARLANVSEGSITIIRPDDAKGVIRGRVRAVDVTTNGPLDYTLGDTFELAEAQYSTSVAIAALADDLTELHEELQVEILVTAGEARPPAQKTEVVILDNDRPITLEVAETTVSVAENQLLEITVQAKRGADTAPLRELPVEFLLTPTYPNSGAASAADFLVTVGGTTRAAQSNAEITVTGVLEPGETEATVRFPVADDEDTADESVTFTVSLPASPGAGVTSFTNSHDGGIVIGSSAATTATLTAAADASPNTLVLTPTTVTRVYGEAAPTAFAFTVAPQSGSAFATGDSASTTFFDTNPLALAGADDDVAAAGTYRFQFKDSDANTPGLQIDYATGIDTKYDFVLAEGAVYSITPKEITFTSTEVDKVYDGTAFAPEFIGTFTETESDDVGHVYVSGGVYGGKDAATAQTITNFGLAGVRAGNYTLASASTLSGDITARQISNLHFPVNAHAPGSAAVGTLTPTINRAGITADGVLAAEMEGFRAGLQFTAAYAATPTARGVNQEVTVSFTGDGLADSGAFKAANYTLESTEDATASGLIAGAAGKPVSVAAARGTNATTATVSWAAPESTGVPNGEIGKYHIRWRSVAVEADAAAGIAAAAAGAWQNAVGESDLGEDVGTETTVIVQGLLPSRGYEMQVVAENEFGAAGRGEYSDSAVAVGIPPKPVITAVTPNGAKQFSIAFTAPLVAAGGETTPVYAWRPLGVDHTGNEWVVPQNVVPNTSRVQNVSPGLTSNDEIQYEVRMALRNAFGTGAWSKSRFVTPPSGNPAAPPAWSGSRGIRELTAYSHGGPNIDVRWSPPPTINLSRQVGRYEVRWKLASATTFAATDKHTLQADGRNTRDGRNAYVIRNLETGVYNVDVRACNNTGCNTWHDARDPGNGAGISTGHGLGNTDNVHAIQEMIVPLVEALEIGDRSLTVNWRPPLYADGSVIDYGFPVTTYRARWRPAIGTNREYLNPLGAAGEVVLNTDPESNARRSYTISGLRNGTHYQVEFWSERQRGTEAGQAKVDAYLNASGKSWTERITQMRAAGSPLENAVFVPRVRVIGAPRGEQPNAIPTLNDLALGAQRLTIAATWSAPTASVSGYQARWRPLVSGANQQTWQVADVAGTSYTITEYTRDDNARGALREIQYEVQVRSRNALGGNAWSQWSASKRITPLSPTLRGIRITGAGEAGVAEVALQSVPPFAVATLSYAVEVPNTANAVHFTPIVSPGRSITIGLAGTRNPPAVAGGARSAAFALEPGATARVEVTVTATAGGLSANSVYVYVLTRAGDPPGPPSGVSANPGTFDLEVSWGAPAASGGDANYSEYRVRWRTVGTPASGRTPGTPPGAWQPNAEGRKVGLAGQTVIRGLTPGTVYEAQVRAVNSRGLAGQWSAPVSDSPRSFTFDVDESGTSDITDGILVGRYLIGLRGAAVTDGQTLPEGMTTGKINGNISVGVRDNRFDVDRDGRSTAQDGIMIMRYSFGVTSGSGLTAGQTNEDAENVAGAIEALQQ